MPLPHRAIVSQPHTLPVTPITVSTLVTGLGGVCRVLCFAVTATPLPVPLGGMWPCTGLGVAPSWQVQEPRKLRELLYRSFVSTAIFVNLFSRLISVGVDAWVLLCSESNTVFLVLLLRLC